MSPRLLPVVLEEQLVPGTFADAVHRLVDVLDLSAFDAHYRNYTIGAPAHSPGMLLKAVLLAYSQQVARIRPQAASGMRSEWSMERSHDPHQSRVRALRLPGLLAMRLTALFATCLLVRSQTAVHPAQLSSRFEHR